MSSFINPQIKKRCKNCNRSIKNKNETGFCSDLCKEKFLKDLKPIDKFNEKGSFNLIAGVIEHMFNNILKKDGGIFQDNREWIKGVVCQAWCDCSSNFDNDKLLKYYEAKYREVCANKSLN